MNWPYTLYGQDFLLHQPLLVIVAPPDKYYYFRKSLKQLTPHKENVATIIHVIACLPERKMAADISPPHNVA